MLRKILISVLVSGAIFSADENLFILQLRFFYKNDQRIYWSGLENTFMVEGNLNLKKDKEFKWGKMRLRGSFFLNQPYGKSILKDPERIKYLPNFSRPILEISSLNLGIETKNWKFIFGKFLTPFGRFYFPLFINDLDEFSPFIRGESILWRETGVLFQWKPYLFRFSLSVVNGEEDGDTNSDKALIIRAGLHTKNFILGISSKTQDGIGSDQFKRFNNYYGVDFWIGNENFSLSGEIITDRYGFKRKEGEEEMYWERSLYYRDLYNGGKPIKGVGGYVNLKISFLRGQLNLNYGEYYPEKIGYYFHDQPIKRFILQSSKTWKDIKVFFTLLLENEKEREAWRTGEKGIGFLVGIDVKNIF